MKITKRQLQRIIKEEKARLQEYTRGLSPQTPTDDLGVLIEKAIEIAEKELHPQHSVLHHLQQAHSDLTGI
jgi:hypothetical protein